jgi:hypothetical protein
VKRILLFLLAMFVVRSQPLADTPARPTLTLTPAVVLAKLKPGQGWTQTLHMSNMTGGTFHFDIEVQDVVVKDGKRTYTPAGEVESSVAASAVVSPRSLVVGPQEQGSVTVTLTIPPHSPLRAVVVYFRGRLNTPAEDGTVGLGASLGALVTFDLSGDYSFKAVGFKANPQTETTNQVVSHELLNSGPEVVVPKGATAILDDSGHSVAKATFTPRRLLPGESLTFSATCPVQLKAGHYRVISSFEFNSRVVTAAGEFSVP